MADVGIDLGTTNSAIAHLRNRPEVIEVDGRQTMPSVVAYDSREGFVVGQSAKDQTMILPAVVSVKRDMGTDRRFPLGGREYSTVEISTLILKKMVEAAESRLGEPVDSAVITIPAYFSGAQNDATKTAGLKAGIKDVRLLAEPIAAALAYGAEDMVLVYDYGGGTFDVAIIDCFDYSMVGLDGDNHLGGDDFDQRLMDHLAARIKAEFGVDLLGDAEARQMARSECERAKIELSTRTYTRIRFQSVVGGKLVNLLLEVTREEFEAMIMDLVDRSLRKVESAIAKAAEKEGSFSKNDIETVLLVGGSTYVPLVRRKVGEFFGREPSFKVNPDLAVALGAAIHTASGPDLKGHRIRLEPLPETTAEAACEVAGRTSQGATVEITGGATTATVTADASGSFTARVELRPNVINDITVVATSASGEVRRQGFHIKHQSGYEGEAKMGRRDTDGIGAGLLPRSLGISVTAQDDLFGVILRQDVQLPQDVETRDYGMQQSQPNTPGTLAIEVYEGEIPYAPLNTHLATLVLRTPPTPSTHEPLEITFRITEDRVLTVGAQMINYPDSSVTTRIDCKSCSGDKLNVLERADMVATQAGGKLRPEDKARLGKLHLALNDLCAQYARDPQPDCFTRVKNTGLELRALLNQIESQYNL